MRKQLAFKDIVMRLILQMIVAVLISIGVIAISEPTTARADGVEWVVDAAGNNYVYIPGEIYWGGSTSRTGLAFYCVDSETGQVINSTKKILYNNKIDENGEDWMNELTSIGGTLRLKGVSLSGVQPTFSASVPITGSWENTGGGSPVKAWLEADSGTTDKSGEPICNAAKLVKYYCGNDAYNKVLKKQYSVCFEGVYGMVAYRIVDGKDVAWCVHKKILESWYPGATDEELAKLGTIKYFQTMRSMVALYRGIGVDITKRNGSSGTANYKWIQGSSQYFSIDEEHFGVPPASKGGSDVRNQEMLDTGWNFGVIEISLPPIHTYGGSTPGNTENPDPPKDGKCTIKKLYYTEVLNPDGTIAEAEKDKHKFSRSKTTNYISVDNESGYVLEGWKASSKSHSLNSKRDFNSIGLVNQQGTSSSVITIGAQDNLYVLMV